MAGPPPKQANARGGASSSGRRPGGGGLGGMPLWRGGGAAVTGIGALVLTRIVNGRPVRSPLTGIPSIVALACVWLARPAETDPLGHLAMGILVLLPAGLFAGYAVLAT